MSEVKRPAITITLSAAQVDEVVRAAAGEAGPGAATLIAGSRAHGAGAATDRADRRRSRSLLRGLALLEMFDPDGGERGISELAGELGMSASTVHRYAQTLVELGLLQRCPRTRRYRLPARAPGDDS
jgi:hypothetical protein